MGIKMPRVLAIDRNADTLPLLRAVNMAEKKILNPINKKAGKNMSKPVFAIV